MAVQSEIRFVELRQNTTTSCTSTFHFSALQFLIILRIQVLYFNSNMDVSDCQRGKSNTQHPRQQPVVIISYGSIGGIGG